MVSENALDVPLGIHLIERVQSTLDNQFRRHILGEIPYPGSWGSSRNAEFHYTRGVPPFMRSLPNLWQKVNEPIGAIMNRVERSYPQTPEEKAQFFCSEVL